jgi:hypothetical protein
MNLGWINAFLPTMRCPDTHQSLPWAAAEDLLRHAMPPETLALARDDGSRVFPIDHGIPILLPEP